MELSPALSIADAQGARRRPAPPAHAGNRNLGILLGHSRASSPQQSDAFRRSDNRN
jgi:hypothetical protein